ncbi:MAG TPA: histidine phosphatase family protein [Acidimicrobiales bacterium]
MIILIRHGQTTTNAQRLLVGRSDPALTELGERQAMALRPLLTRVRDVWTSPLQRARFTAALAIPSVAAVVKESFIEVDYGSMDGQALSVVSEEQWRAFEHDHDTAFGDGESLASVDQRVHAELQLLLMDPTSLLHSSTTDLAIVTHMSPIKSAVTWALGVPGSAAWRMNLRNASITTITTRLSTPTLLNYNVTPEVA